MITIKVSRKQFDAVLKELICTADVIGWSEFLGEITINPDSTPIEAAEKYL